MGVTACEYVVRCDFCGKEAPERGQNGALAEVAAKRCGYVKSSPRFVDVFGDIWACKKSDCRSNFDVVLEKRRKNETYL